MDIEDGNDGDIKPPPASLSITKKFATSVAVVGTVVAIVFYALHYRSNTGLEFKLRPMQMGGDFSFRILDSGSTDKMLLRLQVEEGKRYTIREHSRRVISRGIVLPQTVLEPANAVEQDITMAFDFQLDEVLPGAVRLRFNCTEFVIRHKDAAGVWQFPVIWLTMSAGVKHRPFMVTVANNGTVLNIDARNVHQAVVAQMHTVGALPVELTTALEVKSPPSIKGVYDSLGAQWNPTGQATLEGPVVLAQPSTACPKHGQPPEAALLNPHEVAGSIVMVERGTCAFLTKVRLLHELSAVGVIVVDNVDEDLLLMGGESSSRLIPSVMVKQEVGELLKQQLTTGGEEVWVRLLSGLEAMQKKGPLGLLGGDSKKKAELPDYLGYNSMIEDQIKRRFSIFPGTAVGRGDVWHRKVKMQLQGQQAPTWVDERYQLLSMPDAPPCERSRWSNTGDCDGYTLRDGQVRILMNTSAVQRAQGKSNNGGIDAMTVMQAEDVFVREEGIITVDAASGLLTTGSAMQLMTGKSKFTQVYINGQMQEGAYLRTQMKADTDWQGSARDVHVAKKLGIKGKSKEPERLLVVT